MKTNDSGFLTYDAEGREAPGTKYHSRALHVPSYKSGVTIGRGYDMKEKSKSKVFEDMMSALKDEQQARLLSKSAGLFGGEAKLFIIENELVDFEMSIESQEALFKISYDRVRNIVMRICKKTDTVAAYGSVDWDNLNPKIKEVTIDLCFRGGYGPNSRKVIQKLIADNDIDGFTAIMSNRENWKSVPLDRFERRVAFLLTD